MIDIFSDRTYVLECDRESRVPTIFHLKVMDPEQYARLQGAIDLRVQAALDGGGKRGDPEVRAAAVQAQLPIVSEHVTKINNWPDAAKQPTSLTEKADIRDVIAKLPALAYNEVTDAMIRAQALTELEGKASALLS